VPVHPLATGLLIFWLCLHRWWAHRGIGDLAEGGTGDRPWTSWALIVETVILGIGAATVSWIGLFEPTLWGLIAGNVLMAVAVGITGAARRALGKHFSIHLKAGEDHELITQGIYARIRHPIYTGDFLFQVATPILVGAWPFLVFPAVYCA
jgi:protein-S-isoprenylcysteine O-methyltransferase Ste14